MTQLTKLTALGRRRLAKSYTLSTEGQMAISNYAKAFKFRWGSQDIDSIDQLAQFLSGLQGQHDACIIRGAPAEGLAEVVTRKGANFPEPEEGCSWVMLDIDGVEPLEGMDPCSPAAVEFIVSKLPTEFQDVSYVAAFSNSAGVREPNGALLKPGIRVHLFYWLEHPISGKRLAAWLELFCYGSGFYRVGLNKGNIPMTQPGVDMALLRSSVQVHYTASPVLGQGVVCDVRPENRLWIQHRGANAADIPLIEPILEHEVKERRGAIRRQWASENGFQVEKRRVKTERGVYSSERIVPRNPGEIRMGRELIRTDLRADGHVLGLVLADEKTPNSWYVTRSRPWMATRMGDDVEIPLEEFCPAALEEVKRLGWIIDISHATDDEPNSVDEPQTQFVSAQTTAPSGLGLGGTEEMINWHFKANKIPMVLYAQDGLLGYFRSDDGDAKLQPACSLFYVYAHATDFNGMGWTYVLHARDSSGVWKEIWMPGSYLFEGSLLLTKMADAGVYLEGGQKGKIASYIQRYPCRNVWKMVDRIGWTHAMDAFLLPDRMISANGQDDGECIQMGPDAKMFISGIQSSGTVEAWQNEVARVCLGNKRLEMAIYLAFAPPLLALLGLPNFGVHIFGENSQGKSTAMRVAASVWGHPARVMHRWRATDNGLEGLAYCHNDCILLLDEIGEANKDKVGASIYMLSNGDGKVRANKMGDARQPKTWRLVFLSNGEFASADYIRDGGQRVMGGQAVRLLDVPVDAGAGMGIIESLGSFENSKAMVLSLKHAALHYHGTASVAYLERLMRFRQENDLLEMYRTYQRSFMGRLPNNGRSAQVERILDQFFQIAFAGELAIRLGVLPYPEGRAFDTILHIAVEYERNRGGTEGSDILEAIRRIRRMISDNRYRNFQQVTGHGSRLSYAHTGGPATFWGYAVYADLEGNELVAFRIPIAIFREVFCAGVDYRQVRDAMVERGFLHKRSGFCGSGEARGRCYSIPASFLQAGDADLTDDEESGISDEPEIPPRIFGFDIGD